MAQNNLLEIEYAFTRFDRHWRTEVGHSFGTDGVLRYGHLLQARGGA